MSPFNSCWYERISTNKQLEQTSLISKKQHDRNNGHQLKVKEKNWQLKELWKKRYFLDITRNNIKHLIEFISNIIHWQSLLHSSANCLIDECKANLSSKEKLNIIRKR